MERNRKVEDLAARFQLFPQIFQLQIRRNVQEAFDIVQEGYLIVLRIEHNLVRAETGHNLVQTVLAVPFLDFPHRVVQLVLVEVHYLPADGQVRPEPNQLGQIQHRAGEQGFVLVVPWNGLGEVESADSRTPVPFFGS